MSEIFTVIMLCSACFKAMSNFQPFVNPDSDLYLVDPCSAGSNLPDNRGVEFRGVEVEYGERAVGSEPSYHGHSLFDCC